MFAGTSWASWLLVESPFHSIRLLFVMLHMILWVMSTVGLGLGWLMQVQRCLSLDATSTHWMHFCCFGITVKIIYQSQAAGEFSPHLNGIAPFLSPTLQGQLLGLPPLWGIWMVFGDLFLVKQCSWFLQPLPPMASRTAWGCWCVSGRPIFIVIWHVSLS